MSADDRFAAVRELFDALIEQPPERRTQTLADPSIHPEVRGEVLRLLHHLDDPQFLASPPTLSTGTSHDSLIGERVGNFRILRRLGAGGMGIVYEAEQDQPRRSVALKLIRPELLSEAALARFRRESELLGRLQHPGIAAIHAAGVAIHPHDPTLFLPYCAMELIEGEPVHAWVARTKPPTDERLELLARICDAVDHAHRRGVIHRDLKPANILVTAEGDPKILDFGIARALDGSPSATVHTVHGDVIGTLGSMSPEQLRGDADIDGRADVYAIGSLAYEVLGGAPPFDVRDRGVADAIRFLLEHDAPPLHRLQASLAGDPSIIVATAMAKDAGRRYATAAAMASDLRACRDRRPILARPPGLAYLAKRFAQRHRAATIAAGLVIVTLVGATVWAGIAWRHERDARNRTSRLNTTLLGMLESLDPAKAGGSKLDLLTALDDAERSTADLDAEPDIALAMHDALAERYMRLDALPKAIAHFDECVRLATAVHGESSLEVAAVLTNLGQALRRNGRIEDALAAHRRSLEIRQALSPERADDIAECLNNIGAAEFHRGNGFQALQYFRQAVELARNSPTVRRLHLSTGLMNMGMACMQLGRMNDAVACFDEVMNLRMSSDADELDLAEAAAVAGSGLLHTGESDRGLRMLRKSYEIRTRLLPPTHERVLATRENLAQALATHGELAEAESLLNEETAIVTRTGVASVPDGRGKIADMLITRYRKLGDEDSARRVEAIRRSLP